MLINISLGISGGEQKMRKLNPLSNGLTSNIFYRYINVFGRKRNINTEYLKYLDTYLGLE